jgi:hypothetical protein
LGEMIMKAKEKLTFRECVYGNLMCFDGNLILIFFTISLLFLIVAPCSTKQPKMRGKK